MNNSFQAVDQWLKEIGKGSGLDLSLDNKNSCVLFHEERIEIVIEASKDDKFFYLSAPLVPINIDDTEDLIRFLSEVLTLNIFQIHTQGGSLALEPSTNHIVLCTRKNIEGMHTNDLRKLIEEFTELAIKLRKDLVTIESV